MPPPTATETSEFLAPDCTGGYRTAGANGKGTWTRRLLAFTGPGYLVAVGYMDPGNWATDLAGGARFGYALLWIVMLSNLMAMLLQVLAARLGIATGMDLAQACSRRYSRSVVIAQWLLCEAAICATDLAEVVGAAIALKLLFHVPLLWGVVFTAADVLLILWLQARGMRYLEAAVAALMTMIFTCVSIDLLLAQPDWAAVAHGFAPGAKTFTDPAMLYLSIGIIGATVMPHNLYLHSSIVQHRLAVPVTHVAPGRRAAMKYASIDVIIALTFAFVVNASILMLASAAFHQRGMTQLAGIEDAHHLLAPLLGTGIASTLFALALLAAGQSSAVTATLAGQVVMEGYVGLKMTPWRRRLLTRAVAIVPTVFCIAIDGEGSTTRLLILSQVVLSLQLPFAIVPLIRCTSSRALMGKLVNPRWLTRLAWLVAALIVLLNFALLREALAGQVFTGQ